MGKVRLYAAYALVLLSMLLLRELCFAAEKRSKVIDFDDEVVEGLNKRPLDSLNEIADKEHRKHKPHLYRKRAGFRSETADSLREIHFE